MEQKITEVEWVDTMYYWERAGIDLENLKNKSEEIVLSIGYLIYEDKEKIILGNCIFKDGTMNAYHIIPKSSIRNFRTINIKRKRK